MMTTQRRRPPRGFTLLELIAVTSAVALMSGILLDRILVYQEMAERVSMQQVVRSLRISLQLQVANLIAKNRIEALPKLAEQNPMVWLAQPPDNYAGEFVSARQGSVAPGQWYFNLESRKLITWCIMARISGPKVLVPSKLFFKRGSSGRNRKRVKTGQAQSRGSCLRKSTLTNGLNNRFLWRRYSNEESSNQE